MNSISSRYVKFYAVNVKEKRSINGRLNVDGNGVEFAVHAAVSFYYSAGYSPPVGVHSSVRSCAYGDDFCKWFGHYFFNA